MIKMHLLNHFSANLIGLLFVLIVWSKSVSSGRVPVPVTINKCCRLGEGMGDDRQCTIGGTDMWVPHVYMINKAMYFAPKGEAPRFFKIKEGTKPTTCTDAEYFEGPTDVILFSNGSLFIHERNVFVPGDDYCVEKDKALVCFKRPEGANITARARVKKCCGPSKVYREDTQNCSGLDDLHVLSKNLINSTAVDIVNGFPKCNGNYRYRLAEEFDFTNFDETSGTVTLTSGRKFSNLDYCLEHTVNETRSIVNIFMCADHFPDPEPVPVNHVSVDHSK